MTAFKAIRSKRIKLPIVRLPEAQAILEDFHREGVREVSRYPFQLPPKKPKPRVSEKTGKTLKARKPRPYKRQNILAKSWNVGAGVTQSGDSLQVEVVSAGKIAPYNIHVVGPKTGPKGERQTKEMRRRKWPSAPGVLAALWAKKYRPRLEKLMTKRKRTSRAGVVGKR